MKKKDIKVIKNIVKILLLLIVFLLYNNIFYMLRINEFDIERITSFKILEISLNINDLIYSIFFSILMFYLFNDLQKERKEKIKMKSKKNIEYGSARWGTYEDIKPYINEKFEENIIFSETERLTYEVEREEFKYNRNHNSIIVGMPGTGKTYLYILPNLLQNKGSMVVTDTKGNTILQTGFFFKNIAKKEIKIFNTVNTNLSMKYNPFEYIKTELDILKFINILMKATDEKDTSKGEAFWRKAETLFFSAIIGYMFETLEYEDINIISFLDIINKCRVSEEENETEEVSESVDEMFRILEKHNEKSFAVRQYKKYLTGAKKSKSSIILSVCARISIFDIEEIRQLLSKDELELESLSNSNTIFYIITSDSDRSLDFLTSILYSQLIQILYKQADERENKRFDEPVSLYLDEFKQLRIPDFEDIISTNRSRNIPIHILIQATSQLKEAYEKTYSSIMGNCDSYLFLGAKEKETLKDLKETLDKETILETNGSKTYSKEKSQSQSEKNIGRELMTMGELTKLPQDECIYILRGVNPFRSKKYLAKNHKNYKYVYDSKTGKNSFSIENYLREYRENQDKFLFSKDTRVIEYEYEE